MEGIISKVVVWNGLIIKDKSFIDMVGKFRLMVFLIMFVIVKIKIIKVSMMFFFKYLVLCYKI